MNQSVTYRYSAVLPHVELTQEDLESIRLKKKFLSDEYRVLVYQQESSREMFDRGQPTIATKLAWKFDKPINVERRGDEKPIDDGLTPEGRLEILTKIYGDKRAE